MCLYLLYEGLSFHRTVNEAAGSLHLETMPSEQETRVMRPVSFVSTITNESERSLLLLDARRILPVGVSENQSDKNVPYTLKPHVKLSLRSEIQAKNVGNFAVSKLELTLGSRQTLFLDHVVIEDRFRIIAKPLAVKVTHPIDTDSLTDLIRDETRRGIGTDFAGLRAATYLDNYRQIDWKAVARFGKLYTREFYLDEEPGIMLVVDVSLMAGVAGSLLLEGLHKLVSNLRVGSPLGLTLYDSNSIITTIVPGMNYKERILRALLRNYGAAHARNDLDTLQVDMGNEVHSLSRLLAFESATKRHMKRLGLFARTLLPFYSYADSKRADRLRGQGSYLAFDAICNLRDPLLVVAIASPSSNLEGLVQGARSAIMSNHKVILILLSSIGDDLSRWRPYGVSIVKSTPRNLAETVNSEILKLGTTRSVRV